jgi:hypothetical protein
MDYCRTLGAGKPHDPQASHPTARLKTAPQIGEQDPRGARAPELVETKCQAKRYPCWIDGNQAPLARPKQ